jgi:hypothetical protein
MNVYYMVATLKMIRRPNFYAGGPSESVFIPNPHYGKHARNVDAKRAWVEEQDPDFKGCPDEYIKRQFDAWRSNLGHAKIVCIKEATA